MTQVRTPLSAVCMGLVLIQAEIASSLGYKYVQKLEREADKRAKANDDVQEKQAGPLEWFQLARELHSSALNAANILSEFLTFDKVEHNELKLELTVIPIWSLIERSVHEFQLPSIAKDVQLTLAFQGDMVKKEREDWRG